MGRKDFLRCYDSLLANWYFLSEPLQQAVLTLRRDLHDELASWHPGKPWPWDAFSERLNAALLSNGLPEFFVPSMS